MDDIIVTTTTHIQAKWILAALEDTATWARMKFKTKKLRCLVLKNGRISQQFKMKVQCDDIPTIVSNLIKCIGKWFDSSLTDNNQTKELKLTVTSWLKKVDKSGLPGKYKALIYKHGILPRLVWLLLIYEAAMAGVEVLEKTVNSFVRRWLGVPPSFTSIGLYSKTS